MDHVSFVVANDRLKSALNIDFMLVIFMPLDKFFLRFNALMVEMLPNRLRSSFGVHYIL